MGPVTRWSRSVGVPNGNPSTGIRGIDSEKRVSILKPFSLLIGLSPDPGKMDPDPSCSHPRTRTIPISKYTVRPQFPPIQSQSFPPFVSLARGGEESNR